MNFYQFKKQLFDLVCFNINQVYAWQPNFNRNNITRWVKQGYLVRLRQGYFTFAEYTNEPDYARYFANRIYQPSYISLHTALAFYGIIPESVVQYTSITSLKTASFTNDFGQYSYKSVKKELFFGYEPKPLSDGRTILFATPEKALLDLLYLYPFYNTELEMLELRLDVDYMQEDLKKELLLQNCSQFKNTALTQRVNLLFKTYNL
jgi:predicted transcriptional regulator of viral defense system